MRSLIRILAGASVGALALLGISATAAGASGYGHPDGPFPGFDRHAVFAQTNDPGHNRVLAYASVRRHARARRKLRDRGHGWKGRWRGRGPGRVAGIGRLRRIGGPARRHERGQQQRLDLPGGRDTPALAAGAAVGRRVPGRARRSGAISSTSSTPAVTAPSPGTGPGSVASVRSGRRTWDSATRTRPFFTAGPGQVGFTPDGRELLVTTKSHGTVVGFPVRFDGRLGQPVANPATGAVPFAFSFDPLGRLIVVEAGTNSVSSHIVRGDAPLTTLAGPVTDGQQAACWIAVSGRRSFRGERRQLEHQHLPDRLRRFADALPTVTATSGGAIDLVASPDGRFLYSENGAARERSTSSGSVRTAR